MKIENIKINGIHEPVGYAFNTVRVSWRVAETSAKAAQNAAVEIAADAAFETVLAKAEGDLDNACTVLEVSLAPRTRYFVRVTVMAGGGTASGTTYFETAKMDEPWQGQWITPQPEDAFHPEFCREFDLTGEVKAARLYISGLGLYTARLNGEAFTDEVLTPYYSDYKTEVQYQTFDLTDRLAAENTLAVELGNGWYKGHFGLAFAENNFGDKFQLIAELHILYADGREEVIATDETWRYRGGDTTLSDIYNGETIDRTLWAEQENPWKVPAIGGIEGKLVERYSLPVVPQEALPVKKVIHTPAGETVLDFGQNFAGYVEVDADLPRGMTFVLDFGEILQDGNFYHDNYRRAESRFKYISGGKPELVRPRFTYFGFRYVRVSGFSREHFDPKIFTGRALYSQMDRTGSIETGHAKLNQLFSNVLWGQRSNFIDFPTDCPQRDERLGWTGDAQVFCGTASYNMDTAAFYAKFLHDLRVEQEKLSGAVPSDIPVFDFMAGSGTAVWGDIGTFLPTVLYRHFGDKEALKTHYPMMRDWVDWIDRGDTARHYLFDYKDQLADWLALDGRTEQSFKGGTDESYIASNYYAMSAKMTAEAAEVLGYGEDAARFNALYEKIRAAVLKEYFTSTGRLAVDTQTAYMVALYSGIYPEKARITAGLRERLYKDCYKLKCGFTGGPIFCRVLAENGMEDVALHFLLQEDFPGWMHCIDLGATTIWERWNSVLDDGRLSGTAMNSLNHYAFGSVMEYVYRDVAGITPLAPGFKRARIAPLVSARLGHMKASYVSVHGEYRVEWELHSDGSVHMLVKVPFGCTAEVCLPKHPESACMEVNAGTWEWTYTPTENLLALYSETSLLKEMVNDPRAMQVIGETAPMLAGMLKSGDVEMLNENVTTLREKFFMGFTAELCDTLAQKLGSINAEL